MNGNAATSSTAGGVVSPAVPNDKKRKRPRAARACEFCRSKKYRCDELYPCGQCKRSKVECVYEGAEHVRQRIFASTSHGPPKESEARSTHYQSSDATGQPSHNDQNVGLSANGIFAAATPRESAQSVDGEPGSGSSPARQTHSLAASDSQNRIENDVEISDVNSHTRSLEFHGKTSSIAFLAALSPSVHGTLGQHQIVDNASGTDHETSLVSTFHNNAFSPEAPSTQELNLACLRAERYYFRQSPLFLEGHFQNIHFVHPILVKSAFAARCEELWFNHTGRHSRSFVALYYSVMSLGALVRTWDEGEKIDGLGRLQWSRKLFNLANIALQSLGLVSSDVETVQAQFFMAKVCQNELNPSLAYMHLGMATRCCFSAGYNREPRDLPASAGRPSDCSATGMDTISRTWWGLYSLEIETSFALGRPDSLGSDAYHNRRLPPQCSATEIAIIPAMVHFARIIRTVCTSIYLSPDDDVGFKIQMALQIEKEMDRWLAELPDMIRPSTNSSLSTARITKEPLWAKRQKLVLGLRYYNVKMVLFRPFLVQTIDSHQRHRIASINLAHQKCLEAARNTVVQMHDLYVNQAFFRTWWYNTTYILYAASILLCYVTKIPSPRAEITSLLNLCSSAVDILDAMDESVVARNAAKVVGAIVAQAKAKLQVASRRGSGSGLRGPPERGVGGVGDTMRMNTDGPAVMSGSDSERQGAQDDEIMLPNMDLNLDFFDLSFPLDGTQIPFWADLDNI